MRYCDIHDLALVLDGLGAKGNRRAAAHALRIWRARRAWGGNPTESNWQAISGAAGKAAEWLKAEGEEAKISMIPASLLV